MKESERDTLELLQLVSFKLGNVEFGVDILNVHEINRLISITSVPNSLPFVEGIINLRGRVLPVIDLRVKLGLPKKEFDKDTRIVIVDVKGITVGFLVDAVCEVLRIPKDITETLTEIVAGINSKYITAVGKLDDRLLILLDLNKLLVENENEIIEEMIN